MRYSEHEPNYEIKSPIDTIKVFSSLLILSPFRLLSEIGKRLLFLDKESEKCVLYTVFLNTGVIIVSILSSLLWTKRLYVFYGFFPLVSLLVSLSLSVIAHYFIGRVDYPIDLDKLEDLDKDKALETLEQAHTLDEQSSEEPVVDNNPRNNLEDIDIKPSSNEKGMSALEKLLEISKQNNSTVTETLMTSDDDFEDLDIQDILNNTPKTSIDNLYKHDKKEGDDIMLNGLKNIVMRNAHKKEYIEEGNRLTDKEHLAEVAKEIEFDREIIHKNADFEKEYMEEAHGEIFDKVHEEANKKVDRLMNNKAGVDFIDTDFDFEF